MDVLAVVESVKKKVTRSGSAMAFVTLEDMYGSMEALVFPKVLEKYGDLFAPGGSVWAHGRISFTEEKDPKFICEYASAPFSPEEMMIRRRPAPEEKKRDSQKPAAVPESVTSPRGEERPGVQIKGYNTAYKGLYLRVPNAEDPICKKAMQYIEIFDGVTDLYLYYTDTKKLVRAPGPLPRCGELRARIRIEKTSRRGKCCAERIRNSQKNKNRFKKDKIPLETVREKGYNQK